MGSFSDWLDEEEELGGSIVYIPPPINWEVSMPVSPYDMEFEPEPLYGVPEDWDYKGELGPQNQELPRGAIGWTPHGDPYYGSGLQGWWNGFWNKLVNPDTEVTAEEHFEASKEAFGGISEIAEGEGTFWQKAGGVLGSALGGAGEFIEALGAPVKGERDEEGNIIEEEEGVVGALEDISSFAVRGVAGAVGGLFNLLIGVAEETEKLLFGVPEVLKEIAQEGPVSLGWDIPKWDVELWSDADTWFPNFLEDLVDLAAMPVNLFGALLAPGSISEKMETFGAGYNAGRIAYSAMVDPLLTEEYMRRWRGGEDATLLAMELGNPMAELAGELIFDPLNFIGLITKPLRHAKRIANVSDLHILPATPDLAKALKAGEALNEADAAIKTEKIVSATMDAAKGIRDDFAKFADTNKLRTLTAPSKRTATIEPMQDFFMHLTAIERGSGAANWMENIYDTMHGLIKMYSPDAAVVAEGLADLKKSALPMEMLTSKSALQAGHLLLNMFTDGKTFSRKGFLKLFDDKLRFADEVADLAKAGDAKKIEAFIKGVEGAEKQKYLRDIFTDAEKLLSGKKQGVLIGNKAADVEGIRDMMKVQGMQEMLNERVYKTVDALIPTLAEKVAAGEKLTTTEKAFFVFEKWKESGPIRFVDTFFANIYMGLSPGYVMRNLMVDRLTAFIDTGKLFQRGKPLSKLFMKDKVTRMLGGVNLKALEQGIGQVGLVDIKKFAFLKTAQEVEKNSSILIMYRAVEDTLGKMVSFGDNATIDLQALAKIGADEQVLKSIPKLLIANDYDVVKAMTELRTQMDSGIIDVFKNLNWIPDEQVQIYKQYNLWDHVQEIGKAPTEEKAFEALNDLRKAQGELADTSRMVGNTDITKADEAANISQGLGKGIHDDINALRDRQKAANIAFEEKQFEALEAAAKMVANKNPEAGKFFTQQIEELKLWYDEGIESFTERYGAPLNSAIFKEKYGLAGSVERKVAYQKYFEEASTFGKNYRETMVTRATEMTDEMNKILPVTNKGLFEQSDLFLKTARENDNLIKVGKEFHTVSDASGTLSKNVMRLAAENGIKEHPVALLNTLKKPEYLKAAGVTPPTNFTHYTQMDWDDINKVFKARAKIKGEKFVPFLPDDVGKATKAIIKAPLEAEEIAEISEKVRALHGTFLIAKGKPEEKLLNAITKLLKRSDVPEELVEIGLKESTDDFVKLLEDFLSGKEVNLSKKSHILGSNVEAAAAQADAWRAADPQLQKMFRQLELGIERNWGRTQTVVKDAKMEAALKTLEADMFKKVSEARVVAGQVATEMRHFALHNYGQRYNFDTVLSLFYPYHFWHSRTYVNWVKRIATNPGVIAGYAKYKSKLAEIHANAPEWWRYNVNTAEMFGIFQDNPLFFNLASTLNPMYGLTGVDFTDPYKRVSGFTGFMDDMNKFGPSLWTPLTMGIGVALKMQGEDEAARRWGGRLFPQTKTLDSITSIVKHGIDPSGIEVGEGRSMTFSDFDPALAFFSDGVDAHEERKIGYALSVMVDEGIITEDEAVDANMSRGGEIWDAARERATNQAALGQISSTFLGIGFKTRNKLDLEIQRFDQKRITLMNNRENLSPVEYMQEWAMLEAEFPFADLVMMSRKSGIERDTAFIYHVMGRLPPGSKTEFYNIVGLDKDQVSEFYDTKGKALETWSELDKDNFLNAMLNASAILATPEDATKEEWFFARVQYRQYQESIKDLYGEDIEDKIDAWYQLRGEQLWDEADAYLELHPEVAGALDQKAKMVESMPDSPFGTYYGSLGIIEGFYKGQMYEELEREIDMNVMRTYWDLPKGSNERRQYRRLHPEIKTYYAIKDKWTDFINRHVISVGSLFGQEIAPEIRTTNLSFSQQKMVEAMSQRNPEDLSAIEWQSTIGADFEHITSWLYSKKEIPFEVEQRLIELAQEMGIDLDTLLQLIGISLQ